MDEQLIGTKFIVGGNFIYTISAITTTLDPFTRKKDFNVNIRFTFPDGKPGINRSFTVAEFKEKVDKKEWVILEVGKPAKRLKKHKIL